MSQTQTVQSSSDQSLLRYYRLHAPIYDATRWSFLFGRSALIAKLKTSLPQSPRSILEVGCGTGRNLMQLGRQFPDAMIVGCDLSDAMLSRAKARLDASVPTVDRSRYVLKLSDANALPEERFDLIVCSYMLSMTADRLPETLSLLRSRLSVRGFLAVVDFDRSAHPWFRAWMRKNHVRLDGVLFDLLCNESHPRNCERNSVLGLWHWLLWIGR